MINTHNPHLRDGNENLPTPRGSGLGALPCSTISDEDLPLSTNRTRNHARNLLGEVKRHRQGLGSHGCVEVTNAIEVVDILIADRNRLGDQNEKLREVLAGLVKSHEDWNDQIARVVGRPVGWTDSYLDAARHILSNGADERQLPEKKL